MLKYFEYLLLSTEGNVKVRETYEEMFKKLRREVESKIGSLHVFDVEEPIRNNNVVIRHLVV